MLESIIMSGKKKLGPGADYQSFLTWLAANRNYKYTDQGAFNSAAGLVEVNLMTYPASGSMWGTSWGGRFTIDSSILRTIQHGLPSQDQFVFNLSNYDTVAAYVQPVGSALSTGLNRNGYSSSSYGAYPCSTITKLIYRDKNNNSMMEINPLERSDPKPWSL